MSKPNKQLTRTIIIVVLLIILAAFLRNMWRIFDTPDSIDYITGYLRALIYIGLFSAWGFYLRHRVIQTQARRYLTAISVLMVLWMVARTLKFNFFSGTNIGRFLWYLYYLPMIFIPLLTLFIALSLGKSENFRLPRWSNVLLGISALLLLLVLTNDLHQFVFGFPNGLLRFENSEYTHRFCYFLIMGWIALCALAAFVVIAVKCRVPYSKRLLYFPFIPLILLILYAILYLTAFDFVRIFAGDMTVVICLLTAIALEACIQCGLIQSNTHYSLLFECTSIRSKIADNDYNILLSSTDSMALPKEVISQTEFAPIMLDGGTRLCGAKIKSGHVMWSEDVSEITGIISELADNSEYLATRKSILQKQVETRHKEQRLEEQNRLYNCLMRQNKTPLTLYSDLIEQLENENDSEQKKKLTAKLAVVCTHIKRRGNLLFLSEKSEEINASEVRFALEEWLANLRLYGVRCNIFFNMKYPLSFTQIVSLYDSFQQILIYSLDTLHSLLVSAEEENGAPILLLNFNCDRDLSDISFPGICISDEGDGEWVAKITIFIGGVTV